MRRLHIAAALLCLLASGCATFFPKSADPCRRNGDPTACFVKRQQQWLALYGLQPAESHLSRGEQMRRVFYVDDYARDVIAVTFLRSPEGHSTLSVNRPLPHIADAEVPASIWATVSDELWDEVVARSRWFDRELRRPPPPQQQPGGDTITVCSHAWVYAAEATDPEPDWRDPRPIRRRVENSCYGALTPDFAQFAAETARRELPACAAIRDRGGAADVLSICLRLGGDRMVAAEAYNAFDELRRHLQLDEVEQARALFAPGARIEWNGGPHRAGSAADIWIGDSERQVLFGSAVAESPDGALVRGVVRRWGEERVAFQSPVEMIWAKGSDGGFRVERIKVGAEVRVPGLCPPGLLTGAERANNCHW
jgi:hypothetical protein